MPPRAARRYGRWLKTVINGRALELIKMISPIQDFGTRIRRPGPAEVFVAAIVLVICISPPMFVENASAVSRAAWFQFAAALFLVSLLAALSVRNKHTELDFSSRLLRTLVGILLLATFAAVVTLSIIIANLQAKEGIGTATARTIIFVAEPFFLWLKNFRNARGGLGISDLQIVKIEAIQSLWFIFGVFVWLQLLLFRLITSEEGKQQHQYLNQQNGKKLSGAAVLFFSLFAILMAATAYSGWLEFDTGGTGKKCLLSVNCYQQNDLAIIAAAGLKFFAIFGFLGGAALMVWGNFKRQPRVLDCSCSPNTA